MSTDCRLVMIEWVDSAQPSASWEFLSDFSDPEIVKCASVGWLIHDGEEVKALAQNMGHIGGDSVQVSGVIRIPARCVVRTVDLPEPEIISSSSDPDPSSRPAKARTQQVA